MQRSHLILNEKKILKGMVKLAFPILVSNILRALHDVIDTFFLNKLPNSAEAISSIAVSWPIMATFLAIAIGLGAAALSLISQYSGAQRFNEASLYASKLFGIAVIVGFFLNVFVFFGSPTIMHWMGATGEVHRYGVDYLVVRSFEMIFLFVFIIFSSIRQSTGDTKTPVVLSGISIILNIILTPIFIFHLQLEVFGAALATLLANLVTFPLVLYYLLHPRFEIRVHLKEMGYDPVIYRTIFKVGIPATVGSGLSSFGFVILQAMILSFGVTTAAAFSVGNRISAFFIMPGMSLGAVLSSYIGQNMGAGNIERAKEAYRVSRNASVMIMTVLGFIGIVFIRPLAGLLSSGETLNLAKDYLVFLFLTQPFMALYNAYCGVFDGSGNTRLSFLMHTLRLWVFRIPVIIVLREFTSLGSSAIWICMLLSNILISIVGHFLMKRVDFNKTLIKSGDSV